MPESIPTMTCTAFAGPRRIDGGSYAAVARRLAEAGELLGHARILVFDDASGRQMDFDLRGTPDEVEARYTPDAAAEEEAPRRGPGRPRLGVVSKEVTLLPRHWAWLQAQRGGASATLRRLVDEARTAGKAEDEVRRAQDAAYRFASAMAGDMPGFEEAMRALYAGDPEAFESETQGWADDVRQHALVLAAPALDLVAG